ncbi:RHS repeat-associated core domain-containing protein [Aureispira sp. CCB-E]|uniref:RHS repeat domain-containing protein n=1 Tax=Aureispira sp. CCB-E TaxID=3051121 RepID=UPI002868FE2B|nr:RHS repeat-associated core domain-containing protein [Aureispira sp. CCB-E]WMX16225.1 RHS repeat-associated core domain-containing protein [Aureispira sp. CCB-E]
MKTLSVPIHYLLLLFALSMTNTSFAKDINYVSVVHKVDLIANSTTIRATDPNYGDPGEGTDYVRNYTAVAALIYNRNQKTDIAGNVWSYEVEYDLLYTDYRLGQSIVKSGTLFIEHNNTEGIYEALGIHEEVVGDLRLKVKNITATGNVPNDIHLELQLNIERYDFLDATNPITKNKIALTAASNVVGNQLEVAWDVVEGAEYYELEWVYWDAAHNTQNANLSTMDLGEFFEKAVRIETSENYHKFDLFYPEGTVYIRVRPVGRYIRNMNGDYQHLKYGAWVTGTDPDANAFSVVLTTGFEGERIWQVQRSFAEEAKSKQVIQYFDDGMRGRQTLTNLSSDDLTIVAENAYDVEGRASISILPVPVKSLIGKNPLQFGASTTTLGEGGLISTGAIEYNYNDFDKINHADPLTKVDANGKGHVSNVYYSSANPFYNQIHRNYIPDAEGYPITQVKFLNDATGRIARQSGVGDFYQLGSEHETKYYYSNPTHVELRRLFGKNVGDEMHYRKNYVVDANGQISVSYIDQAGQTIATALAGKSPENVNVLNSEASGTATITSNLMGKNVINNAENTSILSHSIFCDEAPRTDQFTYTLRGGSMNLVDGTNSLCVGCTYEVQISLVDEYGNTVPLVLPSPSGGSTPIYNGINITAVNGEIVIDYNSLYDNTCGPVNSVEVNFEAVFQSIGSYTLRKILKVIEPNPNTLVTQLQNSGVLENKQNFINNYVLTNLDPNECEPCNNDIRLELCEEIAAAEYPVEAAAPSGSTAHQIYLDRVQYYMSNTSTYPDCDDLRGILALEIGLETECASKLERMKQQIAPAGDPSMDSHGCLFNDSQFWNNVYSVNHPITIDRYDVNGNTISQTFSNSNDFTSFMQNQANWQDHLAEYDQILKQHPEYCAYETYCLNDIILSSRRFDFELAKIKTWNDAVDFGAALQSPVSLTTQDYTKIVDMDPFFMIHPTYKADMNYRLANYCTQEYTNKPSTTKPINVNGCGCGDVICYINNIMGDPAQYIPANYAHLNPPYNQMLSPDITPLSDEDKWLFFRGIYTAEKKKLQQQYLESIISCNGITPYSPSSGANSCETIINADDTQDFMNDNGGGDPSDLNDVIAVANTIGTNNCTVICEGNAKNWVAQLCPELEANNSIGYLKLVNDFKQFCEGHCGALGDNPVGYLLEEYFDPNSSKYALDPNLPTFNQDLANAQSRLTSFMNTGNPAYCGYDLVNNPLPDSRIIFNRTDVYEWRTDVYVGGSNSEKCDYLNCFFDELNNNSIFPTKYTNSNLACPNYNSLHIVQGDIYEYIFNWNLTPASSSSYCDFKRVQLRKSVIDGNIIQVSMTAANQGFDFKLVNSQTGLDFNLLEIQGLTNYDCLTNTVDVTVLSPYTVPNYANYHTTDCAIIASLVNGSSATLQTFKANLEILPIDVLSPWGNEGIWVPKKKQFTINLDSVKAQCIEQQIAELIRNAEDAYDDYIEDKLEELTSGAPCMAFTESMKTEYTTTEHHYTLYYYDQAGNLIQTIPPAAVQPLLSSNFNATSGKWDGTDPSHDYEMATTYQYNTLGQVTRQKSPDGGVTDFWYDYAQRLRFSKNAKQMQLGQYAYTKFDAQGRTIEVGQLNGHAGISDWELNRTTFPESTLNLTERIITEYEEASFSPMVQENLRGRVARTYNDHIATYYDYDVHGNVKKIQHQISGFGASEIEYDYDLITGNVKEVAFMKGTSDQFFHRYAYDADNRLTQAMTSTNGYSWDTDAQYFYYAHGPLARIELGEDKVQGLDYFYNLQGWIKGVNNTTRESDMGLDGYVPTGPLNGGQPIMNANKWFGQDEVAYYLGYHAEDYKSIGTNTNLGAFAHNTTTPFNNDIKGLSAVEGLYNGNIAYMISYIPKLKIENPLTTKATQAMVYQYDALHRITQSESYGYDVNNGWSKNGLNNAYRTAYAYDANGNIQSLDRYTLNTATSTSEQIDALTYQYGSNNLKNRLMSIADSKGVTADINDVGASAYTYDAIGNLITDGTNTIEWNLQNKVASVSNTNFDIFYTYDVSGNRLSKALLSKTSGVPTQVTFYVRDASGNIMGTYLVEVDGGNYSKKLEETPIYGSSRLGIHQYNVPLSLFTIPTVTNPELMSSSLDINISSDKTGKSTRGEKIFEISNHLGNVLATVSDQKLGYLTALGQTTAQGYAAQVKSAQDYYPFGWEMPGRKFNSNNYRFGFNGKENDHHWGGQLIQDYGFRLYNPAIGKFLSVDPLFSGYPMLTPYQFASNNPIPNSDLDGLEANNETVNTKYGEIKFNLPTQSSTATPEIVILPAPMTYKSQIKVDNIPDSYLHKMASGENGLDEQLIYGVVNDVYVLYQVYNPFIPANEVVDLEGRYAQDKELSLISALPGEGVLLKSTTKTVSKTAAVAIDESAWARRAKFRKSTTDDAVKRATDASGQLRCTKCKKALTGKKQSNGKRDFQLGHTEGNEWAKQKDGYREAAKNGYATPRSEVIDNYQKNVEVECVNCNASHGGKYGNTRKEQKKG